MFCYVTHYVRIFNLEASFNFPLTFLQLYVTKMFTVHEKLFFSLLPAIFLELPQTRTFSISLEGSSYRESTRGTFVLNASTLK